MALGCLQDDATMTNDNSNRRRHPILSACGGFLFSRKSIARRALHPFFQNAPFPPKSNKTAPAAKPFSACLFLKDAKTSKLDWHFHLIENIIVLYKDENQSSQHLYK